MHILKQDGLTATWMTCISQKNILESEVFLADGPAQWMQRDDIARAVATIVHLPVLNNILNANLLSHRNYQLVLF